MENPVLIEVIGISLVMLCATALLGFFLQGGCGVALLAGSAVLAAGLATAGLVMGGWIGLLAAVLIVGLLATLVGNKLGGKRGARFVSLLWLGFGLSCELGYWVGGDIGLLTISLPANILFWISLYALSSFLLPIRDGSQHTQAFRSLLTFSLGTNYPYLVLKDRTLDTRVAGNPYKAFLSGPGIILTNCDHTVVLTNGSQIKPPAEPGVTFTERFEVVQSVIDLRPQLRAFHVEAHTKDGIAVRVLTFLPFRIHWGGEEPTLGKPFPYQHRAILKAVISETVEQQDDQKHSWDDLVQIQATRLMREIISDYSFDDLCLAMGPLAEGDDDILERYKADGQPFPHEPAKDPRYRIRNEMVARIKKEMKEYGIEVIGGGISNLSPADDKVTARRIDNWRAKWQTKAARAQAEGEARRTRLVEFAKSQIEQELLITVSRLLGEHLEEGEEITDELLAAVFVTSLEKMAENHRVSDQLPLDTQQRLTYLRSMGKPLLGSTSSPKSSGG